MMSSFADLGVSAPVADALADHGIHSPFAIQRLVIGDVLAGRDVLAQSPDRLGQDARLRGADGRPHRAPRRPSRPRWSSRRRASSPPRSSRTRAPLARARGLEVAAVYGGVGFEKQIRAARRAHMLVATPGRLEDLMARGAVSLAPRPHPRPRRGRPHARHGLPARPSTGSSRACPARRQTLFFSATLDGEAGRMAAALHARRRPPRARARAGAARRRSSTASSAVEHEHKLDGAGRRAAPRRRAARSSSCAPSAAPTGWSSACARAGVEAVAMHGDKSQRQRERALARFEAGEVRTLVATDVAARGIDVDGITHVINFDAPADREGYVHRIGRTGRAGRSGVGTTFVRTEDAQEMGRIAAALELHDEFAGGGFAPGAPRTARSRLARRPRGRSGSPHPAAKAVEHGGVRHGQARRGAGPRWSRRLAPPAACGRRARHHVRGLRRRRAPRGVAARLDPGVSQHSRPDLLRARGRVARRPRRRRRSSPS